MVVAYTTAALVKESAQLAYDFLGFTNDAAYTTFVEALIAEAERLIDDHVGAPPQFFKAGGAAVADEYHDGADSGGVLRLRYYPVISVASLGENLEALTSAAVWTARSAGPGAAGSYVLRPESGELVFYQNTPAAGIRNVKVTYTPGYAAVPGPVSNTARDLCVAAVRSLLTRKVLPTELTQVVMNGGDVKELFGDTMTLSAAHRRNLAAYRFPGVAAG